MDRPRKPSRLDDTFPVVHPKRAANPSARCPKVKDAELQKMIAAAWAAGWWCERTGSGHVNCYSVPPAGGGRGMIVLVANTPSDRRTIPNTRSTFRRAGLQI